MTTQAENVTAIPQTHRDILEKTGVAHVATIGRNGEPHSTPVWYIWDGASLRFSHNKSRQKYRNLVADARLAVSITDPDNVHRYLEIRGVATMQDDPEKRFADKVFQKYMGTDYPRSQAVDERVIVEVHPQHVTLMG